MKASATRASGSVISANTKSPNNPPTNPETSEIPSASPARLCRLSSKPSIVVAAALAQLDQQEQLSEFDAGELDQLLAEGETSGEALDGEQVLAKLRQLGERRRAE